MLEAELEELHAREEQERLARLAEVEAREKASAQLVQDYGVTEFELKSWCVGARLLAPAGHPRVCVSLSPSMCVCFSPSAPHSGQLELLPHSQALTMQ